MTEQPTISIPRDIPDVRVLRTAVLSRQLLLIEVESTLTSTTCRRCGLPPPSPQALPLPVL